MEKRSEALERAAAYMRERIGFAPDTVIILGSGLGQLADEVEGAVTVPYVDVPGLIPEAAGEQSGSFICGDFSGRKVVLMTKRLHGYEGYSPYETTFPIEMLALMGAERLVATNAAGAIDASWQVGDIAVVTDHINFMGANPLTGNFEMGIEPRWPDMAHAYTPALREVAHTQAAKMGETLREGVYIGVPGPSLETPAEIRAFRTWGADLVGMSTVFEVIMAAACKMDVLVLSLAVNMASGVLDEPITGEEVYRVAAERSPILAELIRNIVAAL